jgi:molecular chaperone DnaK (HSP70)
MTQPNLIANDSSEGMPSRFIVGIDLGTTNCAVAFVDTESKTREVVPFPIEQWVDWQTIEAKSTLPSFHYQWTEREAEDLKANRLPYFAEHQYCVGAMARDLGANYGGRCISSAKSWLCHSDVDRTSPILPWHSNPDVERISPVEASSRYLAHIRKCWDAKHPQNRLADCDVIITLPASFDEVARELTVQAARLAGLSRIVLIEEPQAAFYAWLHRHEGCWQETIRPGETILICDIGGGTTDFTLIRVRDANNTDEYGLHRVAVGKHLMLGGDNLDLALASAVEPLFHQPTGESSDPSKPSRFRLSASQWEALRNQCRSAKEAVLSENGAKHYSFTISGAGSKLIASTRSVRIEREFVEQQLIEGFFPWVSLDERPIASDTGLHEFGLPFESDPAISRHLAEFLWEHRWDGRSDSEREQFNDLRAARPDWILFNGGVLESPLIRERIVQQINRWFDDATSEDATRVLMGERLDLAVAVGAAYFGRSRRGEGVRIDARLARAYYLEISSDPPSAMCVMPADAKTLDRYVLSEHPFELATGHPVQFPILVSSTHLLDRAGDIVSIDTNVMRRLPAIQTVIEAARSKKKELKQIVIESELSEIGTLELALLEVKEHEDVSHSRWKLNFDLRSTVETDREAHLGELEQAGIVEADLVEKGTRVLQAAFAPSAPPDLAKGMAKDLARELAIPRHEWKPSLLRGIWEALIEQDEARKRTQALEARWINLIGYCLRPGYGFAADDWRVQLTWRKLHGKLQFPANIAESLILWRRIAGGFTTGQQQALWQELQSKTRRILEGGAKPEGSLQDAIETLRLVGSIELLTSSTKRELGEAGLKAIKKPKLESLHDSILWMIARLGARSLVYGPMNGVISALLSEQWASELVQCSVATTTKQFAVMQLTRKTGDRFRDVSDDCRALVVQAFDRWGASERYHQLVIDGGQLDDAEQTTLVGEALPLGIRLRRSS